MGNIAFLRQASLAVPCEKDYGRFEDAELEVTVCPDGRIEVNLFDVIDGLVNQLSDDGGDEQTLKEMLLVLANLLSRF